MSRFFECNGPLGAGKRQVIKAQLGSDQVEMH